MKTNIVEGRRSEFEVFFLERKTSERPQLHTESNFWEYSCTKGIFGFGRFKNLFGNFEIVFG